MLVFPLPWQKEQVKLVTQDSISLSNHFLSLCSGSFNDKSSKQPFVLEWGVSIDSILCMIWTEILELFLDTILY